MYKNKLFDIYLLEYSSKFNITVFKNMEKRQKKEIPEKPKQPLNPYFKFRVKRLRELASDHHINKNEKIKEEWDKIDLDELTDMDL